jgi:hypothetical protein
MIIKGCLLIGALYMGVVGYFLYLTVGALGGHGKHSGSAVHGASAGLTLLQSAPYTGLFLLALVLLYRRGRKRRRAERDAVLVADGGR